MSHATAHIEYEQMYQSLRICESSYCDLMVVAQYHELGPDRLMFQCTTSILPGGGP